MILVTVGTDLPFDRMVKIIDAWAKENARSDVFAQVGEGAWTPEHIKSSPFLSPEDFAAKCAEADVIVAHAGMGTILSALHAGKPLVVMPRRASLGEQRNEHQLATAKHMEAKGNVTAAFTEEDLLHQLNHIADLKPRPPIGPHASKALTDGIREFIFSK